MDQAEMEFTELIDLAAERLGGAVLYANDEFFAPKENLLKNSAPIFIEGRYTDLGKWMDGWESRRKRAPNLEQLFDWCIVRLGLPGRIHGVVVDTSFFRGNYPSHCSIDACAVDGLPQLEDLTGEATVWRDDLRFKIYPDGGVARLRVYGEVLPDWERLSLRNSEIDLAAVESGGMVIASSDQFFGHRHNLIMPGRAENMSDGWETRRRRGPGHDWVVIKLGARGTIHRVEVDTAWFKGNFPESCAIESCDAQTALPPDPSQLAWREVLPRTGLQAHTRHLFEDEIIKTGAATHVRFRIFPDGGVSRLRIYGRITE
jgi:allantoicase